MTTVLLRMKPDIEPIGGSSETEAGREAPPAVKQLMRSVIDLIRSSP